MILRHPPTDEAVDALAQLGTHLWSVRKSSFAATAGFASAAPPAAPARLPPRPPAPGPGACTAPDGPASPPRRPAGAGALPRSPMPCPGRASALVAGAGRGAGVAGAHLVYGGEKKRRERSGHCCREN